MANNGLPFSDDFPTSLFLSDAEIVVRISKIGALGFSDAEVKLRLPQLVSCLDLTSLNAVDTFEIIDSLLQKAKSPLARNEALVAAVCVHQPFIEQSVTVLRNTQVEIATVAGGFPSGQMDLEVKCFDIEKSVLLGATEIDIVINRSFPLSGNWEALYHEVNACKTSCGKALLKVIIATGELESPEVIAKTSWICMLAGADFIKTSTGFEKVNATFETGVVMLNSIREYYSATGIKVGFKAAGGIRSTENALHWLRLVEQEVGLDWANPSLFRIGASSLLDDIRLNFAKNNFR